MIQEPITHASLLANSHQAAAWFPEVREGEESLMCILPFFLSYGMTVEMNVGILIGAKLIVLRDGESATTEEILEWAADPGSGMAQYRLPRQIEFRDSLPENIAGKVLRRVLVEEELAAAGEIGDR